MADGEVVGFGFESCAFGGHYSSSKEKLGERATLNHRNNHHRSKLTREQLPQPVTLVRSRNSNSRASGGPGMQAIFLESGRKSSSGTGVFLPRRAGSDHSQPRPKPACSPVLLPSRVVQALNLNVHALGLQISPQRDPKTKQRAGSETMPDQFRSSNSVSRAHHSNTCTDIFLPKEWSY